MLKMYECLNSFSIISNGGGKEVYRTEQTIELKLCTVDFVF